MGKNICVYSSSSNAIDSSYFDVADELGRLMGILGCTLIYGGANIGLMGQMARSVHRHGGKVVGVIPRVLNNLGITYTIADELIVTADMRERKAIMEKMADAFIGLPGGFGTLEELLEVLTLKQLQQHLKPIVFLNTADFFSPLIQLFERIYTELFAKAEQRILYAVVPQPQEAMDYITSYQPPQLPQKWEWD